MNKSDTIGALAAALAKAQGQMTFASKDATNPHFRAKYADLAAIVEAIRGPLSSNGLAYSQLCDFTESGGLIIETVLMHESGEWISGKMQMPVPKNDPQGIGSATTYGKRYCLAAIVGIAADDDDDGEAAMGRGSKPEQKPPRQQQQRQQSTPAKGKVSEAQTKLLNELGEACTGNVDQMADLLHTVSSFMGKDQDGNQVERYLKIADLEKPNDNEKFQRWIGSALGKLREEVNSTNAAFNAHKNQRLNELKKDMQHHE